MPPVPPRFSMKNCWWKAVESCSAMMRPSVSAAPPAANGAMIFTGRWGQAGLWACVCDAPAAAHSNVAANRARSLVIPAHLAARKVFSTLSQRRRAVMAGGRIPPPYPPPHSALKTRVERADAGQGGGSACREAAAAETGAETISPACELPHKAAAEAAVEACKPLGPVSGPGLGRGGRCMTEAIMTLQTFSPSWLAPAR